MLSFWYLSSSLPFSIALTSLATIFPLIYFISLYYIVFYVAAWHIVCFILISFNCSWNLTSRCSFCSLFYHYLAEHNTTECSLLFIVILSLVFFHTPFQDTVRLFYQAQNLALQEISRLCSEKEQLTQKIDMLIEEIRLQRDNVMQIRGEMNALKVASANHMQDIPKMV